MEEGKPDVSVVMATYMRPALLADALAALQRQTDCVFELIVVDDCSTDVTSTVLAEAAAATDARLRWFRTPTNGGPAVARNVGWPHARAEWVAFTDDDCEVQPRWAAELLKAAREMGADIVQGRTVPNPNHASTAPWAKAVNTPKFSHRYQTCNLLVRRSVLEELGGFDETYSFAGEDADLGWRAKKAGRSAVFAPNAEVFHAVRTQTCVEYLRSRVGWAHLAHFYKVHPEARFLLWARLFHHRTHLTSALLLLGLVTIGICLNWWIVPILYTAFVTNNARRAARPGRPFGSRLRFAALAPIAEVWETANFLRCSIRYRTVVL